MTSSHVSILQEIYRKLYQVYHGFLGVPSNLFDEKMKNNLDPIYFSKYNGVSFILICRDWFQVRNNGFSGEKTYSGDYTGSGDVNKVREVEAIA
jgi:hypothetical protein